MPDLFFQGWDVLGRTLVVGVLAYAALVLFVRISGKRTLSKMNAFDLIVTVALGSTLATILLSRDVALAEGVLALGLLILLQYLVAWSAVRATWFQKIVKSDPKLLFHDGSFVNAALRDERVTREEVLAAARAQGLDDLAAIAAVVLETNGSFSVIPSGDAPRASTLRTVRRQG